MDYVDYYNHLVKLSEKLGFSDDTPSIRFSIGDAFNEEVRAIETNEGLTHEEACDAVSNKWMSAIHIIDPDELEDDISSEE